jgi:hypothetical protein
MSSYATPNLPSRCFDATLSFYTGLGFVETWRDDDWMILEREGIALEFFPHAELDPLASWFSCCLRLDDVDAFYALCKAAGISEKNEGHPRLHPPIIQAWGGKIGALIDPDGSLLRLIQN